MRAIVKFMRTKAILLKRGPTGLRDREAVERLLSEPMPEDVVVSTASYVL